MIKLWHQGPRTSDRVKTSFLRFLSVLSFSCGLHFVWCRLFFFFGPSLVVTHVISSARSTSATSACERRGLCVVAWYSPFSWLGINPHYSAFQAHTHSDTHTQIGFPDRCLAELEKKVFESWVKNVKIERSCSSYLLFQVFPSKGHQHALVTCRYSVTLALLLSLVLIVCSYFIRILHIRWLFNVSFYVWIYFMTCDFSNNF